MKRTIVYSLATIAFYTAIVLLLGTVLGAAIAFPQYAAVLACGFAAAWIVCGLR